MISTAENASIAGVSLRDGDLALYDPNTATATIVFSETLFGTQEDIDAVFSLAVPEPASVGVLGLGLLVVGFLQRRRGRL